MAANAQVYNQTAIGVAAPAHAAEAIIATLPSVSTDVNGANVRFVVTVGITPGADTSAIVLRMRRNNVTGTAVDGTVTIPVTPALAAQLPAIFVGNEPQGQRSYVLTVEQTGASADATVNNVAIVAIVGN